MNQANTILQETCGKLEVVIGAMKNGNLSEEAQYGIQVMLGEIKADIEAAVQYVPS